jgi:hypothetical protein
MPRSVMPNETFFRTVLLVRGFAIGDVMTVVVNLSRLKQNSLEQLHVHSLINLFVHHRSFKKLHFRGCGYRHKYVKNMMQQCNCQ